MMWRAILFGTAAKKPSILSQGMVWILTTSALYLTARPDAALWMPPLLGWYAAATYRAIRKNNAKEQS